MVEIETLTVLEILKIGQSKVDKFLMKENFIENDVISE